MTRPIKFRAWHTVLKQMFSCEEMVKDQLAILPNGRFATSISDVDPRLSQIDTDGVMVPLQYTGLEDKNGVEIYEGDVVDLVGDRVPIHIVTVGWNEETAAFSADGSDHLYAASQTEVIGNIHENPELMKLPPGDEPRG